eukprot:scaffold16662_cov162-Isochrysis_galbana.AAC.2
MNTIQHIGSVYELCRSPLARHASQPPGHNPLPLAHAHRRQMGAANRYAAPSTPSAILVICHEDSAARASYMNAGVPHPPVAVQLEFRSQLPQLVDARSQYAGRHKGVGVAVEEQGARPHRLHIGGRRRGVHHAVKADHQPEPVRVGFSELEDRPPAEAEAAGGQPRRVHTTRCGQCGKPAQHPPAQQAGAGGEGFPHWDRPCRVPRLAGGVSKAVDDEDHVPHGCERFGAPAQEEVLRPDRRVHQEHARPTPGRHARLLGPDEPAVQLRLVVTVQARLAHEARAARMRRTDVRVGLPRVHDDASTRLIRGDAW